MQVYNAEDQKRIAEASLWAVRLHRGQRRRSGELYVVHPIHVALTLIELKMDPDTVIAGLLHDTIEDTDTTFDDIATRYNESIARLVEGVTKITLLKSNKNIQEAETIRKMLISMCDDVRVIIIKLADKRHNMQTLSFLAKQRQKEIAQECLDIYAPLADRLGISWLKDELQDLCLKTLRPDTYEYISLFVNQSQHERSLVLKEIEEITRQTVIEAGIQNIEISTRAKHFYSIYQKMKKRKKEVHEIFDLLGMRIICETTTQCYIILGLIHSLWNPLEDRLKDYIAWPKSNNYQSLHTTIMAKGQLLEVQIRTRKMHETAEMGVAAHWAYKARVNAETAKLPIIAKLKKWEDLKEEGDAFLSTIKEDILKDSIYVFTPAGDVVELCQGATALDFAYAIHTKVGHRTVSALVNGAIVPLDRQLKNRQVVEIKTSNEEAPKLHWLRIVKTTKARNKIRSWLNKHEDNLIIDKHIVVSTKDAKALASQTGTKATTETTSSAPQVDGATAIKEVFSRASEATFRIGENKNTLISIANCCKPKIGDPITGYVSRGRGVVVHRKGCPNLRNIREIKERTVRVEWEAASPRTTKRFHVTARITQDLFGEIEAAVRKYGGHLVEGHLDHGDNTLLQGSFAVEMESTQSLQKILQRIRGIPAVIDIEMR